MAKKSKTTAPVQDVAPGANPYQQNSSLSRNLGSVIGAACLLIFIIFDELWMGTLACALACAAFFVIQVFVDKSKPFFSSLYLYAAIVSAICAYLEYRYHLITDLMTL